MATEIQKLTRRDFPDKSEPDLFKRMDADAAISGGTKDNFRVVVLKLNEVIDAVNRLLTGDEK